MQPRTTTTATQTPRIRAKRRTIFFTLTTVCSKEDLIARATARASLDAAEMQCSGLATRDSGLATLSRTRASSPTLPQPHGVHSQNASPDSSGQESLLPTHPRCESTPAPQPTVLQSRAREQAWIVHIAPRLHPRSTLTDFPASSPKKPCAR